MDGYRSNIFDALQDASQVASATSESLNNREYLSVGVVI